MIRYKEFHRLGAKLFWIVFGISFLIGCFCLSIVVPKSAANILETLGADLVAHFDHAVTIDKPRGVILKNYGGEIIAGGIAGEALSLGPGQYLTISTDEILDPSEGTFTLWVRPHWPSDTMEPHAFISFKWLSPKSAYFVISKGWWEPKGAGLTYFIANNMEFAHTNKLIYYNPGKWVNLTCTWKTGNSGFVRFYVHGFLANEAKPVWLPHTPDKALYIGADKGSSNAKNRWADSDFDEIAIFKRALTDSEVLRIYNTFVKATYVPIKGKSGNILESRVIFDEGTSWMTELGANQTIARIKRAGFNVFVPCVWHGMGTRYPSPLAVPEPDRTFSVDPLTRLIDVAHKNGIEIHAWFTVAARQRDFYPNFYGFGTPAKAFDVHRPEFKKFVTDLIVDVAARYNVDGINLDYIRTMGDCTCTYCQNEYAKQFGRELLRDISHRNRDGTLEPHLQQWHDEAIATIVSEVKNRAKALRSQLVISVDGAPLNPASKREGRNEAEWANAGKVDVVFNMDYSKIPDYQIHRLAMSRMKDPQKLMMLIGNYDIVYKKVVSREAQIIINSIETLRRWPQYYGVGLYLYSMLSDNQIEAISNGPFSQNAKPTWR